MTLEQLEKRLATSKDGLLRKKAERDATSALLKQEKDTLESTTAGVSGLGNSIAVVQNFSSNMRTDVISRFEELITSGVRRVFNKDYKIKIEFSASGTSYHADFFVMLGDGKKVNLAVGEGGGLRDIISVLQRILYIVLEPTAPAKIVFLDENLKALDSERSVAAFTFISGLCKELGVQVVSITHAQAAKSMSETGIASVLEISNDNGEANVKPVGRMDS